MSYVATRNAVKVAKAKPQVKPKKCIDCKYFIKEEEFYSEYNNNRFGKCSVFPVLESNNDYLVSGIEYEENIEYHYCSTARTLDHMCGKEGKQYEQKLFL
jgi:hypothetical protein